MTASKAAIAGDQLTMALINLAAQGSRTHGSASTQPNAPGEYVQPWRQRINGPEAEPIADRLRDWCNTSAHMLTWPDMPDGIEDRNADVWEALIAIADLAGCDWPERARSAAVTLVTAMADQRQTLGIQLLHDLRVVFGDADVMFTETILDKLHALDEAPWSDLRGSELNARGLSSRLRNYDVHSKSVRIGDKTQKGYRREWLHDLWIRYLPPSSDSAVTSVTTSQSRVAELESVTLVTDDSLFVTDSQPPNHAQRDAVTDVTHKSENGQACPDCGRSGCVHLARAAARKADQ
jgi:hypothetical protein